MSNVIHIRVSRGDIQCILCHRELQGGYTFVRQAKQYRISCDECLTQYHMCFNCYVEKLCPIKIDYICNTCNRNKQIDIINEL